MPSVDGTRMVFLSKQDDDKPQAHVMAFDGGEASQVTALPLGAKHATWVPTKNSLIVIAPLLRGFPTLDATTAEL
jgi:hypothetical protein